MHTLYYKITNKKLQDNIFPPFFSKKSLYRIKDTQSPPLDGVTNPTPFIKFLFIGAPNFIQKVGW